MCIRDRNNNTATTIITVVVVVIIIIIITITTATTTTTVPAGSPSRGGDVAVYVFGINQPSLPILFYFLCVCFCLSDFQLYFML